MAQKKVKVKLTLVETAYERLEELFITLKLPPGSTWSEEQLSALVNIGRTPVREAILRMAGDNLLTVIKRAGIVVAGASLHEQLLVLETARELESLVALKAARRALDAERDRLMVLADSVEKIAAEGDVAKYLKVQLDIKNCVAAASRNVYASRALAPLNIMSQRFYYMYHRQLNNLTVMGTALAELTRAIASGDEAKVASHNAVLGDILEKFTKNLILNLS